MQWLLVVFPTIWLVSLDEYAEEILSVIEDNLDEDIRSLIKDASLERITKMLAES